MEPSKDHPPAKIVALVPSHNESPWIPDVLNVLVQVKGIDEILCVDDGSTDGTQQLIRDQFPQVKLLALPSNQGKTAAVQAGLNETQSEYVLMLDADLERLTGSDLEAGIRAVRADPKIDMLLFLRFPELWWARLLRGNDLFSGERILRREDLLKVLGGKPVHGYQLEVAINKFMIDNRKKVRRMLLRCQPVLAATKRGFRAGSRKEIGMVRSIFAYLGVFGFIRQFIWFPPMLR
jgi:glycosyltransferase involved in cell wall biosynthesis